jgi:hypothetical protein
MLNAADVDFYREKILSDLEKVVLRPAAAASC